MTNMKKLFNKAKSSFQDSQSTSPAQAQSQYLVPQQDQESQLSPVTPLDILRYRYHHGTNLGSIFVLEKWLHPSMFPIGCLSDSELSAVTSTLQSQGLAATKAKWESHWAGAVTDIDFEWLVNSAHCTSIRLPIGHFTLGRRFCHGTSFEGVADVYDTAWTAVKDLVTRARGFGIGVLLDLHALPGGANRDAHSGTGTGKAELWGNRKNLELTTGCIGFMAGEIKGMDGVIGLQIANEAAWNAEGMYQWYEEVLKMVGDINHLIPIYVSDGWDLGRALQWTSGRRGLRNPIVVDTHKYYTFSDKDRSQAPTEIISRIPNELSQLDGKEGSIFDRGEAQVIIGEYSCVLDSQTWGRVHPEEREGYVEQFGRSQSSKWQERAGGAYFWTLKMDWMDGGEWGFKEQCTKGHIVPPNNLLLSREEVRQKADYARQQQVELANEAKRGHEDYWNRTCPGQYFEHGRYFVGWTLGFSDALSFFVMRAEGGLRDRAGHGGDSLSCLDIWVKKRLLESGQGGPFAWEWEQGFRAGVRAFNGAVGLRL